MSQFTTLARMALRQAPVSVAPAALTLGKDAGVLKSAVRIEQGRAHDANVEASPQGEKPLQPIGVQDFHIVVQKQKKITSGVARPQVAKPGEIERTWTGNHLQS